MMTENAKKLLTDGPKLYTPCPPYAQTHTGMVPTETQNDRAYVKFEDYVTILAAFMSKNFYTGPGSPSFILNHLCDELDKRFPDAGTMWASDPFTPKYLKAIDEVIEQAKNKNNNKNGA